MDRHVRYAVVTDRAGKDHLVLILDKYPWNGEMQWYVEHIDGDRGVLKVKDYRIRQSSRQEFVAASIAAALASL